MVTGPHTISLSDLIKDMDDMDADLFALKKKPSSVPAQTKPLGIEAPKKDSTALKHNAKPGGGEGNSEQSVLVFIIFSSLASHYHQLWSLTSIAAIREELCFAHFTQMNPAPEGRSQTLHLLEPHATTGSSASPVSE